MNLIFIPACFSATSLFLNRKMFVGTIGWPHALQYYSHYGNKTVTIRDWRSWSCGSRRRKLCLLLFHAFLYVDTRKITIKSFRVTRPHHVRAHITHEIIIRHNGNIVGKIVRRHFIVFTASFISHVFARSRHTHNNNNNNNKNSGEDVFRRLVVYCIREQSKRTAFNLYYYHRSRCRLACGLIRGFCLRKERRENNHLVLLRNVIPVENSFFLISQTVQYYICAERRHSHVHRNRCVIIEHFTILKPSVPT